MSYCSRRGFTLVELLVVIALICLLAGMLFPVLMKAHRAGQRVTCLNHLRQLGLAFTLYIDSHDNEFPDTGNPLLWNGRLWRPVIEPYVGDKRIFWCPIDDAAKYRYDSTSYAYLQTFYHNPEDIIPANNGGYYTCWTQTASQTLSKVVYPSQKILIYEWYTNHDLPLRTMWDGTGMHQALFVDGHVALVHEEGLNLSVLSNHDPNWTVGGIGGKDVP